MHGGRYRSWFGALRSFCSIHDSSFAFFPFVISGFFNTFKQTAIQTAFLSITADVPNGVGGISLSEGSV